MDLIYGTGKSGLCAAGLLKRAGRDFVFFDENKDLDVDGFRAKHPEFKDYRLILGDLSDDDIRDICECIISPGVPLSHDNVIKIKKAGKRILGELELGYRYGKGKIIAITGTNGKTTTTSLVGHILRSAGYDTFVAGNIGDPYTEVADKTKDTSVTVLEVSSFQLETADTFSPDIAAVLNITPDHLDRHGTFENYAAVKMSICKNLREGGCVVLNYDDSNLKKFGESFSGSIAHFSSCEELSPGFFLRDKSIYMSDGKTETKIIDTKDLNILGTHNYENVMAACAMCINFGVELDKIQKALKTFTAVEHRIEFVCERDGVTYYNDSKGTNTDASIKAVLAMERPIILIAGGYDKHADFTDFIKTFPGRVKHMVLIGQCANQIADCAKENGFNDFSFEKTFESCINKCMELATPGDCVLLSPACASWGMFKNFEERGRIFKELVTK